MVGGELVLHVFFLIMFIFVFIIVYPPETSGVSQIYKYDL